MNRTLPPVPSDVAPKWEWHYRALLRLRGTLGEEREVRSGALRAPREEGVHDAIDTAADRQQRDELLAELNLEEGALSEVDAALRRLREGTYGHCEASGEAIPAARLRAIPWTRFTQQAAAVRENLRKQTR